MFKETGGGGFEEVEGGEKRDEAKVGKFARLLEAVHRPVYSKDDVGLAGEERRGDWWVKILIYWGGSRSVPR